MGLRKEGLKARHLRIVQPEEAKHITALFSCDEPCPSIQTMGPEPDAGTDRHPTNKGRFAGLAEFVPKAAVHCQVGVTGLRQLIFGPRHLTEENGPA
ncbi:hypothetical protein [Salipiger sp. IMCC34102]|uniref:hypothetical protein n=1 Tax=Salipiger sp. IMCC34102 TaxID=2510647 RepID=UPI0013EB121A|nr:hypothetical protein [Salipiger sp. IMCC34102]